MLSCAPASRAQRARSEVGAPRSTWHEATRQLLTCADCSYGYWILLAAFLCNNVTFGCGWHCDRIQAKHALAIGLVLQVVSILILMSVGAGSPAWMAWAYAVTMGPDIGSWLPTMSMLVSGCFDRRHYGSIFGAVTIPYSVGSAVGPLVAGRMYDASGSYDRVLVLFLALFIVSIVTIPVRGVPP